MTATYIGIKGTHGPQEILPNSYPLGEANPCPSCPSGFVYETSNGNSIRKAGQLQLRRRLRSGFAASLAYTYSKSIDDDAYLGGAGPSDRERRRRRNRRPCRSPIGGDCAELARSTGGAVAFELRSAQLLNVQAQYTSGQGLEGGTLLGGWRGRALKEWTVLGNLTYGTGLPETPIYPATVPGTGYSNIIRPDLTGAPIYSQFGYGRASECGGLCCRLQQGNGERRAGIRFTGPDQFTFE